MDNWCKKDELINEPLQLGLFDDNKVTLSDDLRVATSFLISPYDKAVRNIEIAFYNNGVQICSDLTQNYWILLKV